MADRELFAVLGRNGAGKTTLLRSITGVNPPAVGSILLDGTEIEFDAAGLLARALQHEVDHLQGILFIDRMNSATKTGLAGRLKRLQKETRG